jgi:fatty acid-binding protein DegV
VEKEEKEYDDQHEDHNQKVVNNHKHKRCKKKTTKIKIRMIRRIISNYSEESEEGRRRLT